ncbi:MAG: polysaccharide deacetylase family protein [Atopobiaceae bacterium]|jgi:peptidoglycan/xylan/chitin deacetylase (PgdA/CDA1 family)
MKKTRNATTDITVQSAGEYFSEGWFKAMTANKRRQIPHIPDPTENGYEEMGVSTGGSASPTSNPYENADPLPVRPAKHRAYANGNAPAQESPEARGYAGAEQASTRHVGTYHAETQHESAQHTAAHHTATRHAPAHHAQTHPQARQGKRPQVRPTRQSARPQAVQKQHNAGGALVALIVVAIFIAVGLALWLRRSVPLTVDGNSTNITIGSTLDKVMTDNQVAVSAGNLVSINGDVLQDGGGDGYEVTIDGQDIPFTEAGTYRIKGGESITFANGNDICEDYDVTSTQDVQPKLSMEGKNGIVFYVAQWGKPGKIETRVGKTSGQTAEVAVNEVQDCIVKRASVKPANDEKLVALTFDDGPSSEYTNKYLDILDQYGIKATFFMLGPEIKNSPDIVKRIVESGNQAASHTWHHKQLSSLEAADIQSELKDTFDELAANGVQSTTLRPPYGSINSNVWLNSEGMLTSAIIWTHDTEDWKRPGADTIVSKATGGMYPGSIILMHDGGGNRDQDVEALPRIIEAWQDAGYRFVTVSELLASDPDIPENVGGYAPMPQDAVWPTEFSADSVASSIP